jgi:hypothetical protein
VRYSQALASTEINPYFYDGADTCRKVQRAGTSAIYLVIDRSIRLVTSDFWANWVSDKTYEILTDISMFTLENHPLNATSRVALDSVTGQYFLLVDGFKHWISGDAAKSRCGFALSSAKTETLDSFQMGKVISLNPEDHVFQCQLVQRPGTSGVFFAHENELHELPSAADFNSVFKTEMWSGIKQMSVLPLPVGTPMWNAELIKNGTTIYLVYAGTYY